MDKLKIRKGWPELKKLIILVIVLVMAAMTAAGCGAGVSGSGRSDAGSTAGKASSADGDRENYTEVPGAQQGERGDVAQTKLQVICTLFPQYDFARYIAGDLADVTLLLSPGMEAHMYDPTPADMKKISRSDLFIYTGDAMEGWAAQIVESLDENVHVLDLSGYVTLREEDDHGENEVAYGHDGIGEGAQEDHEGHHHHGGFDPHYWLDMTNAAAMANAVGDMLSILDPANADTYAARTAEYVSKLQQLDDKFYDVVQNSARQDVVFGGRFAYSYFMARYGLNYATVYHSCSAESDPSVSDMIRVIDYIEEHQSPCILYEELSNGTVAKTIADDANIETAVFTTGHNVSLDEFSQGVTFIDLMDQNLEILKKVLND